MISTTCKCDKCGAEQSTKEQFWELSIEVTHLGGTWRVSNPVKKPYQVCRNCLEHLGIYTQKIVKESPEFNPPTIEELLKELILNTIAEAKDYDV